MSAFNILRVTRKNMLSIVNQFDNEQLNHIPERYNNNLIWNLGHVVVTQQLLCYKLSNLDIKIDPTWIDKYRKGTKPEGIVSDDEIALIKKYAIDTVDQMEADFKAGHFKSYNEYTTSFGVTLDSSEKAISFNNVHEGMHLGFCLALKKSLVTKS